MRSPDKQPANVHPLSGVETSPMRAVYTGHRKCDEVAVSEVSQGGARLCGRNPPEPGDEVVLDIESIKISGTVAWIRNGEFGVAFDEPLKAGELGLLELRHQRTTTKG